MYPDWASGVLELSHRTPGFHTPPERSMVTRQVHRRYRQNGGLGRQQAAYTRDPQVLDACDGQTHSGRKGRSGSARQQNGFYNPTPATLTDTVLLLHAVQRNAMQARTENQG